MKRRSLFLMIAVGLLVCGLGTTGSTAGTVVVNRDGGTFNFTLMSTGGAMPTVTITYSAAFLTTVNGAAVAGGPVASTLASDVVVATSTVNNPPFTTYTFTEAISGLKTFGDTVGTDTAASLNYKISGGTAANPGFLNLTGAETLVVTALLHNGATDPTTYDFSQMGKGPITLTYTEVFTNFAAVIAAGGMVTGTGGFTEQAVPEPTSIALLGIGMTGFLAFRRFFRRTRVAS